MAVGRSWTALALMTRDVLVAALWLAAVASAPSCGPTPAPDHPAAQARVAGCQGATGAPQDVMRLRETTNNPLSQRQVGVADIFERELPDSAGAVASRLSAQLVIFDPATNDTRHDIVIAGSVVDIGGEHYCVVAPEAGTRAPGWLSIGKLP
jgi:hypothetical protein